MVEPFGLTRPLSVVLEAVEEAVSAEEDVVAVAMAAAEEATQVEAVMVVEGVAMVSNDDPDATSWLNMNRRRRRI